MKNFCLQPYPLPVSPFVAIVYLLGEGDGTATNKVWWPVLRLGQNAAEGENLPRVELGNSLDFKEKRGSYESSWKQASDDRRKEKYMYIYIHTWDQGAYEAPGV